MVFVTHRPHATVYVGSTLPRHGGSGRLVMLLVVLVESPDHLRCHHVVGVLSHESHGKHPILPQVLIDKLPYESVIGDVVSLDLIHYL